MSPTGLSASSCSTARHLTRYLPRFRNSNRTAVFRRDWKCVQCPYMKPGILSRLRIIEYVQYSVASGQLVPLGSHVTEESYLCILITVLAVPSVTPRDFCLWQDPARFAISLTLTSSLFANSTLLCFVIIKTRLAPEISVMFVTGNSNPCGYARRTCYACLVTCVTSLYIPYCKLHRRTVLPWHQSGFWSRGSAEWRYTIN
jgi:hypothetical protein